MFKNLTLLLLILLAMKNFSQQSDKISFESGSVFDKAFKGQQYYFKQKLFSSSFFKFEYIGKSWATKKWSIFIPLGISYMRLTNIYSMESSINTCIYHNANIYFGPQVQYQSRKIRSYAGVFLNGLINIHTQTKQIEQPFNITPFYSSNNFTGFGGYLSARLFCLYKVGTKTWIGPTCDIFFLDILYVYNEIVQRKNPTYQKSSLAGVNGSSLWLAPGLKLQIDLK